MQKQALAKMETQNKPAPQPEAQTKYHNKPKTNGGIKFDSTKESNRFDQLMLMLKAGQIKDLRLQVNFTLQEGFTTPEGERIKPIIYKADFVYKTEFVNPLKLGDGTLMFDPKDKSMWKWDTVVEDVKSKPTKTKTYLMKKKMMLDKFGIAIKEVTEL